MLADLLLRFGSASSACCSRPIRHPLAEYAFRDDGTRVYPHNDDALLYRVLNDVGNCVHGLRKLAGAFRVGRSTE